MDLKINTKRLLICELSQEDAPDLAEAANDPQIGLFVGKMPFPFTLRDAQTLIHKSGEKRRKKPRTDYDLGIILKKEKKLIGCFSLFRVDHESRKAGIGFWIHTKYRGQGYASEAKAALLAYGFTSLKLNKIYGTCASVNAESIKLFRRFGFRKVGVFREDRIKTLPALGIKNKKYDILSWELLKKDFLSKH